MVGFQRRRWDHSSDIEEKRTEILRSLGDVLRDRKSSTMTMQEIADRLGLTRGNLYHYFRDKGDLLFQCHMRTMEGSLRALRQVADMPGTPRERLQALLILHIRAILDESYGAVLLTDLEGFPAADRRRYIALRDTFERGVRDLIEAGVAAGEFPPRNTNLAGFAILGGINWISKWYHPDGPETSADIARTFAELYVSGLSAPIRESEAAPARAKAVRRRPAKKARAEEKAPAEETTS